MYTQTDTDNNVRQRNRTLLMMALWCLPGLVIGMVGAWQRIEWLCIAGFVLCGAAAIFQFDLKLQPVLRYGKFLREIRTGLSHRTAGTLLKTGRDRVYTDGVWFYEVILNVYEDLSEEGERRFLLDCAKSIDENLLNQDVVIESQGNVVLSVERMGGSHAA